MRAAVGVCHSDYHYMLGDIPCPLLHLGGAPVRHCLGASCLAEECVVAEQSIVAIPSTVPPRIEAILGCAVITGVGAVLTA
jgi:Zn-dependent alcohol dehydrogenase